MASNAGDNGNQGIKRKIAQCSAKNAAGQIIPTKMFELAGILSPATNGHDGCDQSTGTNSTVINHGMHREVNMFCKLTKRKKFGLNICDCLKFSVDCKGQRKSGCHRSHNNLIIEQNEM